MGSPEYLKPAQVESLRDASRVTPEPVAFMACDGGFEVELTLKAQSVNHLRIEWQIGP